MRIELKFSQSSVDESYWKVYFPAISDEEDIEDMGKVDYSEMMLDIIEGELRVYLNKLPQVKNRVNTHYEKDLRNKRNDVRSLTITFDDVDISNGDIDDVTDAIKTGFMKDIDQVFSNPTHHVDVQWVVNIYHDMKLSDTPAEYFNGIPVSNDDVVDVDVDVDYSKMSQNDLKINMDIALDAGDTDTLDKLSPFLESAIILKFNQYNKINN